MALNLRLKVRNSKRCQLRQQRRRLRWIALRHLLAGSAVSPPAAAQTELAELDDAQARQRRGRHARLARHLARLDAAGLCALEDALKIGVHWDVDVTDAPRGAGPQTDSRPGMLINCGSGMPSAVSRSRLLPEAPASKPSAAEAAGWKPEPQLAGPGAAYFNSSRKDSLLRSFSSSTPMRQARRAGRGGGRNPRRFWSWRPGRTTTCCWWQQPHQAPPPLFEVHQFGVDALVVEKAEIHVGNDE